MRCGCGSGASATFGTSDCATVAGTGAAGNPYIIEPRIDPRADNLLSCQGAGLLALLPDPQVITHGWLVGGEPPADARVFPQVGTTTYDLGGPATGGFQVVFDRPYTGGLITALLVPGGAVAFPIALSPWWCTPIDDQYELGAAGGIAHDKNGSPLIGGMIRINWATWGWDTP